MAFFKNVIIKFFLASIVLYVNTAFAGSSTEPDLSVTITAASNPVLVKDDIQYTIIVTNSGTVGAIDSKVTTTIPSTLNYSFGGSGWSCSRSGDTVECTYSGVLGAGSSANTLTLSRETTATGSVTQSVTVSATNGDYDTTNNNASVTVDVGQTNLQIAKTASSSQVEAGQAFSYTLTASNPANGITLAANNIVITDSIPSGFTITSLPSGCSNSGQDVTCNITTLNVGDTQSFVIQVEAPSTIPATNPVTNTATLTRSSYVSGTNRTELPVSSSVDVEVVAADVTVSLSANPSPSPISDTLEYTVTASNINVVNAEGVVVTINLDGDLTYQSDTAGCSQSGQTLTCSLGTINGNSNKTFNVLVTTPSTHQIVTTTADITTTTAESNSGNNNTSLDTAIEGADLRITKTGPDSASVETNIQYIITVYNDGIADAENVVVIDTLDTGMVYLNDSLTNNCQDIGNNQRQCNLGTIAAGSNVSFTLDVTTPNKTGSTVNSVDVTTTTDQNNNTDTTASKTTTLITPNLNIAKSNTPTEVGLGGSFTYTVTVTNSENAVAQNATVTDTPPAGVRIDSVSENNDGWSCSNIPLTGDGSATFTCTLASFPANGTSTIKFNATAPNSPGTYQNRARISHSLNSNDGEDTSNLTVTGVVLDVTKSAPATAVAGGTIDYEITVKNSSLTDAGTLTLTDDLTSTLGAGYTVNSVTDPDGWNCSGTTTLTCTRNTLSAGGTSSTIKFRVNVPVNASLGTVNNSANVHIDSPNSADFASNSAPTVIQGADIVVTKSGDTVGIANETVNFNIIVTNQGNAVANDVNVTIDLNTNGIADFSNIETDCGTGTYGSVSEPFTCQLGDLAQNGSVTVGIRATAPNYDSNFPGHSDIANSASAVTSTSQSDTANDSRNWNVEIRGADLIVDKVPSANEVAVGEKITYTISLRNQGDAVATNIVLSDSVLETTDGLTLSNLNYNSADWSCTTNFPTGFDCTYNGSLASGQSTSNITVDATAPNSMTALDQQRSNRVEVSNDTAESDIATTNSKVAPVTIRGAALTIDKSVSPNPVSLQQQVTFTIRVDNSGLADADNTEVTDTLPNGFTSISTSGCDNDGSSVSGQTVTCQLGTIAKTNGTKTFTITANAPNANGTFTNTATVSTSTPEAVTADNSDSAVLNVEGADLIPYKAAPARVAGNSEFEYTISLQNSGRSSAYGAEINDTIPTNNGTTYVTGSLTTVNGSWTCTLNGLDIHCFTNDPNMEIPSGYNENIATFRVKAGPAHYFINNTVIAGTDTSESDTANNTYTATTEVIDIDLLARKLVNGVDYGAAENYAAIGETITYTLQISNVSPVNLDITDATVTDIIPNNVTNVSVTPAADFTCNNPTNPGDTLLCTMNSGIALAQGQTRNVATITVTVIDAAAFDVNDENNNFIINRYKAETTLSDQDLANNAPTAGDGYLHTNTLVRGANVSVDKTGPTQAGAEQNFTYTLNIRNWPRPDTYTRTPPAHDIPSTDAADVVVVDTLPSNVTFVSAGGSGWSCSESGGKVTCTHGGDIPPSNTPSSIDITVTAPNNTGITLTNEANVTTSTPELVRLLADNRDTLNTDITGTDIVVTKTGTASAGMGDELSYTIRVENISTVPAAGIHVDDILHTDVNLAPNWDRDLAGSGWSCVDNSASADHNVSCDYTGTLPANGSAQFTIYTIAPNYTGTIRNRAVATTTTAETTKPNISDFDTQIIGSEIDFANNPFEQSPNPVGALRPIDYNITIINRGQSEGRDINLTMQFATGFSPEFEVISTGGDTGWSCDPFDTANVRLVCHLPSLAPDNATSRVAIRAIAPNANQDVSYTITVVGADAEGNTTSATISPTTTVKGADLKVKKYVQDLLLPGYDDSNVTVGMAKYVEYNITLENLEIGYAKDINLTDVFDSSFTDLSIQSQKGWSGCVINSNTLTCTDNGMFDNEGMNEVVVRAKTPYAEGRIDNRANVATSTLETDTTNNRDDAYIVVEGSRFSVDVNVSKTILAFDEIFDYNVTILNTGKNEADDINVSDILPAGFTYVGNSGSDSGWSCSASDGNRTVLCRLAHLAGYNTSTLLVLNVKAPQRIGKYTNEVTVSSPSIPAMINASAQEVEVRGADLEVALLPAETEVLEEHNTTVTFVVKNGDISTAHDINTTLTFTSSPPGTFVRVDDNSSCTVSASSAACHWDALAPDENRTVTVTLTTPAVDSDTQLGLHISTATVTQEADYANNEADATIEVKAIKAIAEWRMDECSWGTVVDQTGNHNGTPRGDAHTVNKILTIDKNGKVSFYRAGAFDGNGDYISIPNSSEINTAPHNKRTVSLWFNARNTSGTQVLYEEGGSARGLAIYIKNGMLYVEGWNRPESGWSGTYLSTAISADEWHHVVMVLDADTSGTVQNGVFRAYLDGTRFAQGEGSKLWGHGDAIGIGAVNGGTRLDGNPTGGGRYFNGFIDEVKLFNIALDDTAVSTLYEREYKDINYDGTARTTPMQCQVNAEVTISAPATVPVESNFQYTITVNNLTLEPIEEINLTVQLPSNVEYVEDNITQGWNIGCSFDDATHIYHCYFSDEGNLSNAWFYNSQEIVRLTVTAPNEITNLTTEASIKTYPTDYDMTNNSATASTDTIGTNLKTTKSVDLTSPALNAPFVYTISVTNDSTVDATDVTVTDNVPESLSISSTVHDQWDSFNYDNNHVVAHTPSIKAGETKYFTLTVSTGNSGTVVNSAFVSAHTAESDYGDNNGSVTVNVGGFEGNTTVILKDGFKKRKTEIYYGDLVAIGNTYLYGYDANTSALLADINITSYGDLSTAGLTLPYDNNITVTYARLYWTGHLHGEAGNASSVETNDDYKNITFVTPWQNYSLRADENDTYYYYNKTSYDTYRRIYACSVDVTQQLQEIYSNRNTYNGTYGVKNLKANTGIDPNIIMSVTDGNTTTPQYIKIGHFGGWSLVVFYEVNHRAHRDQVYKNINIFDGFRKLIPAAPGYERLRIPIDGFLTPYAGETIDSRLMLFAGGGERARAVDYLTIVKIDNNISSDVNVSDALNPENNVLNGTITRAGSALTPRSPSLDYSMGIDMDEFDITSNFNGGKVYLGHLQGETNVTLSVGREKVGTEELFDQSFPSAIGLSTEIFNPDFIDSYKECFVEEAATGKYIPCKDTNITRGGEIIYRITIINTGNTDATKVFVQDPLPAEVDFNLSSADLKVVSITEKLCGYLDGTNENNKRCLNELIANGYFDKSAGLTQAGKEYISSLDTNASTNRLKEWDINFPETDIGIKIMTNEEMRKTPSPENPLTTIDYPNNADVNRTLLTVDLSNRINYNDSSISGTFPALNVSWIEFKVRVNTFAQLNKTFVNKAIINFTNPTLEAFGYDTNQSQESASADSPPVTFQWTALASDIKDPGRVSVGTKIVNNPFDLNISIDDSNSSFATFVENYKDVNLTVWGIRLLDGNSSTVLADFNSSDFDILNQEYQPISADMSWLIDRNITLDTAQRDVWFSIQYKVKYKDTTNPLGYSTEVSPIFYGPYGDNFAVRPKKFIFVASKGTVVPTPNGDYLLMKSAEPFDLDINATESITTAGAPGYTIQLLSTDINDSNTTYSTVTVSDINSCISGITSEIHLKDFNFTDGTAETISNVKFDDVGYVTITLRDINWTYVDIVNNDCNNTLNNNDNNQSDRFVSCHVQGETKILFIPADIEVNTTVTNQGGSFTYMANNLDEMRTEIGVAVRVLNAEGNVTKSFKSGCYAEDTNISVGLRVLSGDQDNILLAWKREIDAAIQEINISETGILDRNLSIVIDDSNFSDGNANAKIYIDANRTVTSAHLPIDLNLTLGYGSIEDYLGIATADIPENNATDLSGSAPVRFWYARLHAPDYRSEARTINTPIFIEVYCDPTVVDCAAYGINGFPESSDDVNWWINTGHTGSDLGKLFDINATRNGNDDPLIKINGGTNAVIDLNASFENGRYTPSVEYTGSTKLYKTKIWMRPSDWLKYNRFFTDGRTSYNVEYNLPAEDWSGIGTTGETVETNGSSKSNRRLEW